MPPKSSQTAAPAAEAVQDVQAEIATEAAVEPVAAVASEPLPASEPAVTVTARVLVAVTIGDARYQPNDIIADLPEALANSHAGALDRHPAAIELALADGGKIKRYEG